MNNVLELNAPNTNTTWKKEELCDKYAFLKTNEKHKDASDRYKVVNTSGLIDKITGQFGFELSSDRILHEGSENHGKHILGFKRSDVSFDNLSGVEPRLFLRTSHDRTCSLQFIVGALNFSCANGLFSGSKEYEIKANHTIGLTEAKIERMIQKAVMKFDKLSKDYDQLKNEAMPQKFINRFLDIVANERIKLLSQGTVLENKFDLLIPKQDEFKERLGIDNTPSFFSIWNTIDENMFSTKGNRVNLKVSRFDKDNVKKVRSLKGINNEKAIVDFKMWMNRQINDLFLDYRNEKCTIVNNYQKLTA